MTLFNPSAELVSVGIIGLAIGFATPAQANSRLNTDPSAQPVLHTSANLPAEAEQSRLTKLRYLQATAIQRQSPPTAANSDLLRSPEPTRQAHADGVYLYGQQPLANQAATAYFVFESQADAITGAFYMPNSSFDCVQGQMRANRVALEVTDSYTRETHTYAVGLNLATQTVASSREVTALASATPPSLKGYYLLPVSDRDRDILAICQAQL